MSLALGSSSLLRRTNHKKISENHKEEVVDEKENQKTPAFLKKQTFPF